jgi:phosphoglycerol transferase MdoB-like AlkP superfamily enzyme
MGKLQWLNIAAGILHTVVFIGVLIWLITSYKTDKPGVPTSLYATVVGRPGSATVELDQVSGDSPWALPVLILLFELITLVAHFCYAGLPDWYNGMISKGNNWARWWEYGISSTLMIAIIALSLGVRDFDTVITLCLVNFVVMRMGDLVEKALGAKGQGARTYACIAPTIMAWILFVVVWYNLTMTFSRTAKKSGETLPAFVPAIYGIMFVLFGCFGVVQAVQVAGKAKEYRNVETAYVILSFVAKTLLSFLVVSGLVARSESGN